jgi:hypothetical protein
MLIRYGFISFLFVIFNWIAVDDNGGVHFTWTKYIIYPSFRHVYYNYVDIEGNWMGETAISQANGAGYPQLVIAHGNQAGITYHSYYEPNIESYVIYVEDQYYDPPDLLRYRCFWPKITIDRNEFIHIIATENPPVGGDPMIVGHCYSANGGYTWSKFVAIDTLTTVSAVIVSSPVSDKVSLVYCHPTDLNWQIKNDIYFRQIKFDDNYIDYRGQPVNITEYGQGGDSLYAFNQLDAIYDNNDNLHIIWIASWVSDQGVNPTMFLYHYDLDSGIISDMNRTTWQPYPNCLIPEGNFSICNVSMAVNDSAEPALFAVYSMFDTSDCSSFGYANADLYLQYSSDGGLVWSEPANITNTHTPGCLYESCHSEVWPSVANRIVDYQAHITYIDDISGGGPVTNNPVYYHRYNVWPSGFHEEQYGIPGGIALLRAYPNPFNARTTIEFALAEPGDAELTIYDITGAKVETIQRPGLGAGRHSMVWNADNAASGVYFARLEAGGESRSIKMVLLK